MNNKTDNLENLFSVNVFSIPQYQRAYSWETEPHLIDFISDLRQQVKAQQKSPDKNYFLGTVLLHKNSKKNAVDIVDGQQRLTTSVIFIAAGIQKHKKKSVLEGSRIKLARLKRLFIFDDDEGIQKFKTIKEDNDFFRSHILSITGAKHQKHTNSAQKLEQAKKFFLDEIQDSEWSKLIDVLVNSQIMTYVVNNSADATQIFELQNDRGKGLTELEAIKSYLMHLVYLHDKSPDDRLSVLQNLFSRIFRHVEALMTQKQSPEEDAIFSYHCAAFLPWISDEWRQPKNLIKNLIQEQNNIDIPEWIENFVSMLERSYLNVYQIFNSLGSFQELTDLVVLGRLAPFWPLLLRTWTADTSPDKLEFRKSVRLMEVYSFRGYGISNLRSDAGQSTLYKFARIFESFKVLNQELIDMCYSYDLEDRFSTGLESVKLYKNNRSDTLYLLWKYENALRTKKGNQQPILSWKDYIEPRSNASKFSLEHITAQSNPMVESEVVWSEGDEYNKFSDVALHRLGNLVIDSISSNASKRAKEFSGKLKQLSECSTYLSQGELIKFASDDTDPVWNVDSVRKRHIMLIEFAKKQWNPNEYI